MAADGSTRSRFSSQAHAENPTPALSALRDALSVQRPKLESTGREEGRLGMAMVAADASGGSCLSASSYAPPSSDDSSASSSTPEPTVSSRFFRHEWPRPVRVPVEPDTSRIPVWRRPRSFHYSYGEESSDGSERSAPMRDVAIVEETTTIGQRVRLCKRGRQLDAQQNDDDHWALYGEHMFGGVTGEHVDENAGFE